MSQSGTTTAAATTTATATGTYTVAVTGLTPGTLYNYRAYVTNSNGTVYGAVQTFTTLTPTIAVGALTPGGAFSTTEGTASATQTYALTGTNLIANLTVGPLTGYEFSTSGTAGTYAASLSYTPSSGSVSGTVYVRLSAAATAAASPYNGNVANASTSATTQNVAVTGTVMPLTTPVITATGTFTAFTYVAGSGPSASQSFSISGSNLTPAADNLTVTATNYEFAISTGGTYSSSLNVPYTGGTLASTTLYARLVAGLGAGTYNENLTVSGGGATAQTLPLTGSVSVTPVVSTTPATSITASTATLGGNITTLGSPAPTANGVVYSLTSANAAPTLGGTGTTTVAAGPTATTTGTYTVPVSGLSSGSGYSYRAYVTNANGTVYGAVQQFTTVVAPIITVTPTSLALGTVATNTAGPVSTYTVSGSNLNTDIIITPPAGVEISLDGFLTTANTNATPLTLTQTGGTVATTTISVRIASSASTGGANGIITNTSGSTTSNVTVTGTVAASGSACLSEGFEAATFPPTGWIGTNATRSITASDVHSGAAAAAFASNIGSLTTPALANPSSLTFYLGTSANTSAKQFQVNVSTTSQTTGFATVQTYSSNTTGGIVLTNGNYSQFTVDLSAYTGFSTVWIQFAKVNSSTTSPFRLDDVAVTCGAGAPAFTLTTGSISGSPFCINQGSNTAITVPYTVSGGSFGTGNVFTAYLSDKTGSFASETALANPVTGVSSGSITANLPAGTPTGTGYRVRVKASTPATTAADNGTNLSVGNSLDNELSLAAKTATPGNGQVLLTFTQPATCVTGLIITAKLNTTGTKPLVGTTYTANSMFGGPGSTDLGGGQYVVYNNASLAPAASGTVTVTGLTNGSLYEFEFFTTGGNGYSNGSSVSARPVQPATVADVLVPQYISARSSSGAHATRLAYVWRVQLTNLTAGATYNYYTAATIGSDAAGAGGAGIPLEAQTAGTFKRGTSPGFGLGSSFIANGSGSYTGWFALEPSADARFAAGSLLYPTVVINDGQGGTAISQALRTTNTVTAVLLATGTGNATGVQGSSFGTPSNFVLTYDNTAPGSAINRPLAGTWIESDGTTNASGTNGYATFYASNVDGQAGAYGLLTPNTNANGIQRVEQRALADGSLVGCAATDADGSWPGGANTVNPTGGLTALVLTTGDTPFAAPTVLENFSPTAAVAGTPLTINGNFFTSGPRPTVSFNGGTPVVAGGTSVTSLTVVVPAGATSGPLSVTTTCGTATTIASFTVTPNAYYTKATGDVNVLATYGTNADGSGTAPTSFALGSQIFTITGTGRSFSTGNFAVSGTGAKVVLAAGATFTIPTTGTFTGTLDQSANSTLVILNTTAAAITGITQGVQSASSTIDLAQAGTYTVPTALSYQNLKLTNGSKNFDDTTIPGDLTFDNTIVGGLVLNGGGANTYSAVSLGGNLTQLSGVSYDRTHNITLNLTNTGTTQTLAGNGGVIEVYQLKTTGAVQAALSGTSGGTVLMVGNLTSGGINLQSSTASLLLNAGTTLRFFFDGTVGGGGNFFTTSIGKLKLLDGSNLELYRTTTNNFDLGQLIIDPTQNTVSNLLLNSGASGASTLTLNNDLTITGTLSLVKGTLSIGSNTLTLNGSLSVLPGGFLNGSSSSNLTVGGSGAFGTLSFASGAQLLNNLTLNRSGGTLALGAPLTLDNVLALTNGVITTTAANLLSLTTAATISGGSASSFISGPIARATGTGARTVLFPVGKGSAYRPITLNTAAQTSTTTYTAELQAGSARTSTVTAPLTRVSNVRYYSLTPTVQPSGYAGTATLTFDTDDLVNYPADATFVVAKRTNSSSPWTNFGRSSSTGTANGGNYVAGTLTSGTFTSFSDFALASTAPANSNNAMNTLNPLPVELTRFAAQRQEGKAAVALTWATASEKNSAYFEIQRSLNGETFATVATVAAQGSTAQAHTYATLDREAPAAQLYYRLRQVDANGSFAYSPVVVVMVAPAQALSHPVTLFPNPARETVSFQAAEVSAYRVLNVLGQPLLQGTVEAGAATVPVAKLPAGAYFLELQTSGGRTVRRFVKE